MKAIILLSGGLDSTVVLALAIAQKRECYALSFDYGQRHKIELKAAQAIASHFGVDHRILSLPTSAFEGTSLVSDLPVPKFSDVKIAQSHNIGNVYVPARNTLFLAFALGQAEILGAEEIHFGANIHDYPQFPDCSPEFFNAFQNMANMASRSAKAPQIQTPLIQMTKAEIVQKGIELSVPLELTHSCYDPSPQGHPCHQCLACLLREEAFLAATRY